VVVAKMSAQTERSVLADVEEAAFRLLWKFHRETDCGRDGMHWAECERLIDALGWESWEVWCAIVRRTDA
jgi:hypothetical protein